MTGDGLYGARSRGGNGHWDLKEQTVTVDQKEGLKMVRGRDLIKRGGGRIYQINGNR